jgi:hypothetical protein
MQQKIRYYYLFHCVGCPKFFKCSSIKFGMVECMCDGSKPNFGGILNNL